MKPQIFSFLAIATVLFSSQSSSAQGIAINTSGSAANSSAMLDVASTTQGMLVPRMDSAQRSIISSPATGLLVYQTDGVTPGFYFYNGAAWTSLSIGSNVTTQGNTFNGANQLLQLNGSSLAPAANLGSGTANSTTFLRGDNNWATVSGGSGTVTSVTSGVLSSGTTAFTDTVFRTTVSNATSTPSIAYVFTNAAAYSVLTNSAASPGPPTYGQVVPNALYASSGSPSSSTYYRGDGQWATPAGGSSGSEKFFEFTYLGSGAAGQYQNMTGNVNNTGSFYEASAMDGSYTIDSFVVYHFCKITGAAQTITGTLYKNASATSVGISYNYTGSETVNQVLTTQRDNSHSFSVSAGDFVMVKWVESSPSSGVLSIMTCYVYYH